MLSEKQSALSLAATLLLKEAAQRRGSAGAKPPSSDDELRAFVWQSFGVRIPNVKVCDKHVSPWQAFCDAYFARSPVAVWKASRGFGGKSFLLSLLGLTEAITLRADVNVLGGTGEQSIRVHEHMEQFWAAPHAPRALLANKSSKRETRLTTGNEINALMASQASVRGPHPQRLRLDEVDEMDLTIMDAAMGQQMSKDGVLSHVVQSSTHQYADGTMSECLKRAVDHGYPVYEWCYRESMQPHGWLSPEDVTRKKLQMTEAAWNNEVELQEPSPDTRAINGAAVAAMFRRELGEFAGAAHEYIEIEPPIEGERYATSADWAKEADWTIIPTYRISVTPMRLVAFIRAGREPWPVMTGLFNDRCKRYPGTAAHDATGIGNVVKDYIDVGVYPFVMVGRARANLLTEYIAAIERGEIEAPMIRYMESEHRLASRADVYQGGDGHHLPDTMSAGALAYFAGKNPSGADLIDFVR